MGRETSLPQVAAPALTLIDYLCVAAMCFPDGAREGFLVFRNGHQMDVIGHETVGPDGDTMVLAPTVHEVDICEVVGAGEEGLQSAVASLRYVVGDPGDDGSRYSRHDVE